MTKLHKSIWIIFFSIIAILIIGLWIDFQITQYEYWQARNIELPHSTFAPVDDELNERLIQQLRDYGKDCVRVYNLASTFKGVK